MSIDATRWAWEQKIKPSCKLVLLSLADRAGEQHECYPSITRLCDDTGLDRKTVIKSLNALCDSGLIRDTGKRKGITNQIPVYHLLGVISRHQPDDLPQKNDTETGTVPKPEQFRFSAETVPLFPDNSTVFPPKESQKRDTEPTKEPIKECIKESTNNNQDDEVDPVLEIFDYWKAVMQHDRARLDARRRKFISEGLKCGYEVHDLKAAILGCSLTPHNIGVNDRNQRYDGLHIIFKDADQIDRFIKNSINPPIVNQKENGNDRERQRRDAIRSLEF
jgi:hypothetical protein